jgi:PAS domain S-box-containing protein
MNKPDESSEIRSRIDGAVRLRAEEAVRHSERRLCALVENAADCVSLLGPDGRFIYTSPAASRINGYSQEEFLNQNAFHIIHPEDLPRVEQAFQQIIQEPGSRVSHEFRLRHRDGTWRWIDAIATNRLDDPALLGIVVNYRDITDRKRIEAERKHAEELSRSNKELEQFALAVSHDLQEPLRMVTSFVQLLAERYRDKFDERGGEYMAFAVDGATRMQSLIADLLAFARVGGRELVLAPADMGEVLDSALFNLKVSLEESGAVVTHDPMPWLVADEGQLVQVFQNLIGNAIKFRRPEVAPRIHCSARLTSSEAEDAPAARRVWLFTVRDNGIGIESKYFGKIFEIFQRLQNREQCQGTGIGLAICKKIVERHGGRIWVESEPGQGSTFSFILAEGALRADRQTGQPPPS